MACVTLKRPHHALSEHPFEPASPPSHAHHRPPPSKRRRCVPLREHSRDRYEATLRRQGGTSLSLSDASAASSSHSAFNTVPLSPAQIANNLRDELKRLKRRKQIPDFQRTSSSPPSSPEPMMDDAAALRTATVALSAAAASTHTNPMAGKDGKPIFTLKQMTMICQRMCKERTDQVRAEYDKILQQKLGEQYDAFVKFIDHQIQQRFNQSQLPSYLS